MRFSSRLAKIYRKNGNLLILKDFMTEYYDMCIQYPSGKVKWIDHHTNKSVLIREAKKIAMKECLGFDEKADVIS